LQDTADASGFTDFDLQLAWEAVRKNAFTPPDRDTELRCVVFLVYREGAHVEAVVGLTTEKSTPLKKLERG
jgi:hypothetical protein